MYRAQTTSIKKGRVVIINGRRFFSPNSQRDVRIPPKINFTPGLESDYFGEQPRLADFMEPRWICQEYAFLCAVPLHPVFRAPLFDVLHSFPPIEKRPDNTYQLPLRTIEAWRDLEQNLRLILGYLGSLRNGYFVPFIPPPSSFGYTRAHKAERFARRKAILSRDWFIVLMAAVSYLLRGAGFQTGSYWYKHLVDRGVPESWLGSLQASDAYVQVERVGAFMILGDKTRDFPQTSFLLRFNIPIWYPWEHREENMMKGHPDKFFHVAPSSEQLENPAVLNWYDTIPSQVQCSDFCILPGRPVTPPNPRSGQKPGQTWQEFFEARELLRKEWPESEERGRLCEYRERNHSKTRTTVFEWLQNSAGQWLRHPMKNSDFARLYDFYSESERKFDAARNQWDFCEAFSGTYKQTVALGVDDHDEGEWWDPSAMSSEPTPTGQSFLTILPSPPKDEPARSQPSVIELLSLRYGFVPPVQSDPPFRESTNEEWNKAMLSLGFRGWKATGNQLLNNAIVEFLASLVGVGPDGGGGVSSVVSSGVSMGNVKYQSQSSGKRKGGPVNASRRKSDFQPRPSLWDLDPQNRFYSIYFGKFKFKGIQSITLSARGNYFVLPNDADVPWTIALTSATDLLHMMRANCTGLRNIVEFCLSIGIPFRTFARLSRDWAPRGQLTRWDRQHIPFTMEIPVRSKDYKYTPTDYAVYEGLRGRILAQTHASAARKLGGIVWRLSRGYVTDEEVLEGPSDTSKEYGIGYFIDDWRSPGGRMCDDQLTDNEVDLICGLHMTATEIPGQTSKKSWWPLHSTWMSGTAGFNAGWWTPQNENWFQRRLRAIRDGTEQPLTASQWTNALKGQKLALRLRHNTEIAGINTLKTAGINI